MADLSFDIIARDLASKAFGDAGKSAEGFAGKLTAIGGLATGVVGAGLTKLGEHLEETRKTLEQTISDAGQSFDEFSKQIDKTAGHEEKFGHSTADTNDALSILTRATGDTGKALSDMNLVTEIAAAHHSSLAEAADTVARMHGGAMRSLKEFGISTADVSAEAEKLAAAHGDTAKEEQFAAAQTLILQKIHGTAEAQAATFGGKIKALKTHFMDLAAELGTHVGPALTVAGPLLLGVGQIISSGLIPKLIEAAAGFSSMAVAALASFASMVAEAAVWAASMVASAAIAMAPFLPFIAAIAAIGVAAYLLYRNWDTIWGFIKTIVRDAVGFVTDHLTLILTVALGPIGFAIGELATHWDTVWGGVKTAVQDMWKVVEPILSFLKRAVDDIVGPLEKVAGAAGSLLGAGGDVKGFDSHGFKRALGGPVTGGRPYLVGEVGPELFMPGQSGSIIPNRSLGGFGGPMVGQLHVHTKDDPNRIGLSVNQALRDAAFLMGV